MLVCANGNRDIKAHATIVLCSSVNCNKTFHKGCLRIYRLGNKASSCCIETHSKLGRQSPPINLQSPVLSGNLTVGVPTCPEIVLPPTQTLVTLPLDWSTLTMD